METTDLRELKRAETKEKIIDVAVDLFLERGFRQTRIDDIASAIRISRRTFFNYYPTKEDVFSEWFRSQGEYLVTGFSAQPKEEAVWMSLQIAYASMHSFYGKKWERVLKIRQLLITEPALMAKKFECLASTTRNLTPVVAKRLHGATTTPFLALIAVQAALGAYNAACAEWEASPKGRPFRAVLKRAFALAEPALTRRLTT